MMMRTKTKRTKTSPTSRRSSANPTKTSRLERGLDFFRLM
jgi:hypothetical protein